MLPKLFEMLQPVSMVIRSVTHHPAFAKPQKLIKLNTIVITGRLQPHIHVSINSPNRKMIHYKENEVQMLAAVEGR